MDKRRTKKSIARHKRGIKWWLWKIRYYFWSINFNRNRRLIVKNKLNKVEGYCLAIIDNYKDSITQHKGMIRPEGFGSVKEARKQETRTKMAEEIIKLIK